MVSHSVQQLSWGGWERTLLCLGTCLQFRILLFQMVLWGSLQFSEPVSPVVPTSPGLSGFVCSPPHCILRSLIAIGSKALGVFKIEIERQPQRHCQADFVKLMLEHKGGTTEERKEGPLNRLGGWLCWAAGISWGKVGVVKRQACELSHFRVGRLTFPAALPGNYVRLHRVDKTADCSLPPPRKAERPNLNPLRVQVSGFDTGSQKGGIGSLCSFEQGVAGGDIFEVSLSDTRSDHVVLTWLPGCPVFSIPGPEFLCCLIITTRSLLSRCSPSPPHSTKLTVEMLPAYCPNQQMLFVTLPSFSWPPACC